MTIIKTLETPLEFHKISRCPRCFSKHIKTMYTHKRYEGWSDKELMEKGEPPDSNLNMGTEVSVRCGKCNCLVHYKE